MINIELTKLQKKHFDSIKWLLNDERRDGKTYLLAICFIQKAIRHQGIFIKVFDHFPYVEGTRNIMIEIRNILTNKENFTFKSEFKRDEFRII